MRNEIIFDNRGIPDIMVVFTPDELGLSAEIKGKTVKEALTVTNKTVMEALDGLPPVKVHCSLLAEEAIHAALWDYAKKHGIEITGLKPPVADVDEREELLFRRPPK